MSDSPPIDNSAPLLGLSKDFSKLYNNPQDANVLFKVGLDKTATFYGHTLILQCRSTYFQKALSEEWKEHQTTTDDGKYIVFEKPNISKDVFALLLRFLYTGVVDLIEQKKAAVHEIEARAHQRNRKKQPRVTSSKNLAARHFGMNYSAIASTVDLTEDTEPEDLDYDDDDDNTMALGAEDHVDFLGFGHDTATGLYGQRGQSTSPHIISGFPVPLPKLDYDGEAALLLDLLVASDELLVTELTDILQQHLITYYSQHIEMHALRVLQVADQHSWPLLKHYCMDVICKDPYPVFFSDQLANIDEALLIEVLKCDELRMKEIDVWECVVAWGLLQVAKMGGGLAEGMTGEDMVESEDEENDEWRNGEKEEEDDEEYKEEKKWRHSGSEKYEMDTDIHEMEGKDSYCSEKQKRKGRLQYRPSTPHRSPGKQPTHMPPLPIPLLNLTATLITPTIPFNFSHKPFALWTKLDFRLLHLTLLPLLPHIRLFHIAGPDFLDRVEPYNCVPEPIRTQLLHYYIKGPSYKPIIPRHLSPPYRVLPRRQNHTFSSILITDKHRLMIDNWIRGHDDILYTFSPFPPPPSLQPSSSSTSYTSGGYSSSPAAAASLLPPLPPPHSTRTIKKFIWTLQYRASRDGYDARDFHRHCDGQGATVSILRVKGTGEIIGGYNPEGWQSVVGGRYKTARGSFLFTITGGVRAPTAKKARGRSRADNGIGMMRSNTLQAQEGLVAGRSGAGDDASSPRVMRRAATLAGGENLDRLRWSAAVATDSEEEMEEGDDFIGPAHNSSIDEDDEDDDEDSEDDNNDGAGPSAFINADSNEASYSDPTMYLDDDYPYASTTHRYRFSSGVTTVGAPAQNEPTLHRLKHFHSLYAIYNHASYGPIFGGGHDLFIGSPMDEPTSFARCYAYEGAIRNSHQDFAVEELEVWGVKVLERA